MIRSSIVVAIVYHRNTSNSRSSKSDRYYFYHKTSYIIQHQHPFHRSPINVVSIMIFLLLLLRCSIAYAFIAIPQRRRNLSSFSSYKIMTRRNVRSDMSSDRPKISHRTTPTTITTSTLQLLQAQSSIEGNSNEVVNRSSLVSSTTKSTTVIDTTIVPPIKYHHLTNVERIFCLSDLHTDHVDNLHWLRNHSTSLTSSSSSMDTNHPSTVPSKTDLVIVAGDISHQISIFQETISILLNNYQCQVLFVPGNHEAWLSSSSSNDSTIKTSFDKLQQIYDLCRSMGVYVDPVYIDCNNNDNNDDDDIVANDNNKSGHPVWILPLQSWYDGSLTFDETLCEGFDKWPWMDFIKCQWGKEQFPPSTIPPNPRIPQGLVEHFLQWNQENILLPFQQLLHEQSHLSAPCITVSHFAPNQQCLPDWKDISMPQFNVDAWLDHGAATMSAKFAKVAGTKLLDDQIRTLLPSNSKNNNGENEPQQQKHHLIHIFGHSHRPKDFIFNRIRYIHNPLGKPRERQLHMISPDVTFQYIWNSKHIGEIPGPTIMRYWEDYGGGKEMLWERMSSSSSSSSSKIQSNNTTTLDIQGGRYRQQRPQ